MKELTYKGKRFDFILNQSYSNGPFIERSLNEKLIGHININTNIDEYPNFSDCKVGSKKEKEVRREYKKAQLYFKKMLSLL